MFIIKRLSQHVSGIIMPIIRRTRPVLLHMVFCTGCAGCGCVQLRRKLCVYYQTSISTCFGHHYAHHQENKTVYYCIWCSVLVVLAVVMCSWVRKLCTPVHTAYDPWKFLWVFISTAKAPNFTNCCINLSSKGKSVHIFYFQRSYILG